MKKYNYIFSGYGHSVAPYKITNSDLENAITEGYIEGFNPQRIRESKEYKEFITVNQDVSPVDFFVEHTMGFKCRYHVTSFPPHNNGGLKSTDLAVMAIEEALKDSNIHPENIGAWIVSTASPHEQAPGIAGTIKTYFVNENNHSAVRTLTAGCPGFHEGLRTAIDIFNWDDKIEHIVVAHTETMSSFLNRRKDLVSLATFGDAAAAVVISRINKHGNDGLYIMSDFQDPRMIGYLGVTNEWDLYIDGLVVKNRAIANMAKACKDLLEVSGMNSNEIDIFIPHQTGNKILFDLAEKLNIAREKLYLEVQQNYGNLSGASIPFGLKLLQKSGKLMPGATILSTSVGVGGEYGAFIYKVPKNNTSKMKKYSNIICEDLVGKTALITGASSSIGSRIANELSKRGAELILHYHPDDQILEKFDNKKIYIADFTDKNQVQSFVQNVKYDNTQINFIIHTAGIPGSVDKASSISKEERLEVMEINYQAPINITIGLKDDLVTDGVVLYIGSLAEDFQFEGSAAYVSSKRALHGHAASMAGELYRKNVKSIYYMCGLMDSGMVRTLGDKQISAVLSLMNRDELLNPDEVADRIVRSLYKGKVLKTTDTFEGRLIVRRDGYKI